MTRSGFVPDSTALKSDMDRLVSEVAHRRLAGEKITDERVIAENPRLMPDLKARLHLLSMLDAVVAAAPERAEFEDRILPAAPSREDAPLLAGVDKKYEIIERIHGGGQGVVYHAIDRGTGKHVAIKVLWNAAQATHQQRRRMEVEADALSQLNHPNIVKLHESSELGDQRFIVMEYIDGLPIDSFVMLRDLKCRQVVELALAVCDAVSFAHQHGIIHRDLKPSNILVDENGVPHVCDFGLAKFTSTESRLSESLTTTGQVGTLPYMSPEQATLDRNELVDLRSDVYALGVILFKLLTFSFPYSVDGQSTDVRYNIANGETPSLKRFIRARNLPRPTEGMTPDLDSIIATALMKNREERYQSVTALADDLRRYLAGQPVILKVNSPYYLLRRFARRYRIHLSAAAVCLVLLGGMSVRVAHERSTAIQAVKAAELTISDALEISESSLRHLAGGPAVSERILKKVSSSLDMLTTLSSGITSLSKTTARFRKLRGDVAKRLGDPAEARRQYEAGLKAVADSHDNDSEPVEPIEEARILLAMAPTLPKPDLAIKRGVELCNSVAPTNAEARRLCAAGETDWAAQLRSGGDPASALQHAQRALQLASAISEKDNNIDSDRLEAEAAMQVAQLQADVGKADPLPAARNARQLAEKLVARDGTDVELRFELVKACTRLGDQCVEELHFQEAIEAFKQAEKNARYLCEADPSNIPWKLELCKALAIMGFEFSEAARRNEQGAASKFAAQSLSAARQALELSLQILQADPNNENAKDWLLKTRRIMGQAIVQSTDPQASILALEHSVDLALNALKSDSRNIYRMDNLVSSYDALAAGLAKLKRLNESLAQLKKARDIQRKMLESNPDLELCQTVATISASKLATAYLRFHSDIDDAIAGFHLQAAETMLRKMVASPELGSRLGLHEQRLREIDTNRRLAARRSLETPCSPVIPIPNGW